MALDELPTGYLLPLPPLPTHDTFSTLLARLEHALCPPHVVDLTCSTGDDTLALPWDSYEQAYARQWLVRLLSLDIEEECIEKATKLLSILTGQHAPDETTYLLPTITRKNALLTPPDSRAATPAPRPCLKIKSIPSHGLSTGHVTWTSAGALSRLLCLAPLKFFGHRRGHRPLRVLEIGSGTGLVGLTAATVLASLDRDDTVTLSDFDDAVLKNLERNVALNELHTQSIAVSIRHLDWSDPPPELHEAVDLILAADVLYEPAHADLLHRVISHCMRRDGTMDRPSTAWIMMPVRETHGLEYARFDERFGESIKLREHIRYQEVQHVLVQIQL